MCFSIIQITPYLQNYSGHIIEDRAGFLYVQASGDVEERFQQRAEPRQLVNAFGVDLRVLRDADVTAQRFARMYAETVTSISLAFASIPAYSSSVYIIVALRFRLSSFFCLGLAMIWPPFRIFIFLVSGWIKQTKSDSVECFTGTARVENSERVSTG
jgi:hypothetical protein